MGLKVRQAQDAGEEVPAELQAGFDKAEEALYKNVRAIFGGSIRQCVTGAAPIAQEILEFFYACGVPVMEGYGMTETSTVATVQHAGRLPLRLGRQAHPRRRGQGRRGRRAAAARGQHLPGLLQERGGHRRDAGGRLAAHRRPGPIDEDGFVYIIGRKKDIIITAGGKNITPANLENGLKQNRWISQAVVIGDRRPYLVALITLDPEEAPAFAEQHGVSVEDLPESEADAGRGPGGGRRGERQGRARRADQEVPILPEDLSQESGELTPTLKVKRNVVNEKHADAIEALYAK